MRFVLAPDGGFPIVDTSAFDTYLGAVAAAGFDGVTLNLGQLAPFLDGGTDTLTAAAQMLAAHGLFCSDVMSLAVRGQARDELEQAKRITEVAAILGAESIGLVFFTVPTESAVARLGRMADVAVQGGVKISLEIGTGLVVGSIPAGMEIVNELGTDRIGICLDTYHFFRGGSTWADLETIPLESVLLVQFDDAAPVESDDIIYETNNRRRWPGQGEFELTRFSGTLRQRGWDGIVSVEVLSTETRQLDLDTYAGLAYTTSVPYWR